MANESGLLGREVFGKTERKGNYDLTPNGAPAEKPMPAWMTAARWILEGPPSSRRFRIGLA